ncbi:hypothetical protein LTR84_010436 [Exophiala bonariae]|uniref:Protein kinase domain-containing protein n=1 Tax=Exophiala bonariae TaxID=1690606 RepID=A0AAV9MW32_9EURO|nr:hypothetical protein LTR84_010436 [Exophiala bonariae]
MSDGFFGGSPIASSREFTFEAEKFFEAENISALPRVIQEHIAELDSYESPPISPGRELPDSKIRDPDLHDLVLLSASVESTDEHNAGHIADAVCRFSAAVIGAGATFVVRKVRVPCKSIKSGYVATKSPRLHGQSNLSKSDFNNRVKDMIFELRVLRHRPLMQHPNIISLLGISWSDDDTDETLKWPTLVLEYGNAGSLLDLLRAGEMEFLERHRIIFEVGRGLSALHSCGVVHSDIKCENVIIFQDHQGIYTAKLADFGCSLVEHPQGAKLRGGTPPWTSPDWREWLPPGDMVKSDVYSFGLLVWRVMTYNSSLLLNGLQEVPLEGKAITVTEFELAKRGDYLLPLLAKHCATILESSLCELVQRVLHETVRLDPASRNLSNALEVLHVPDATTAELMIDLVKEKASAMSVHDWTALLAPHMGIDHDELLHLRKNYRSDEEYLEQFRHLVEPKLSQQSFSSRRRIDQVRIFGNSEIPDSSTRMITLGLSANEVSTFSADHLRLMQPQIQEQTINSLVNSADSGSRDSSLFLSVYYFNVRYDPVEAIRWLSTAAELGNSTARYLYYRLHEATGIKMKVDHTTIDHWLYQGSAWGSWIAFDDKNKHEKNHENPAKIILRFQGSYNGDTPFREEALIGRFCISPMGTQINLLDSQIASTQSNVDDIVLAGMQGNRLLHWAAGVGALDAVKHLIIHHHANVNCLNDLGETPLLAACRAGNGQTVAQLLKEGADPSLRCYSRQYPIHWLWTLEKSLPQIPDHEKMSILTQLGRVLSRGSVKIVNSVADPVAKRINGFQQDEPHSDRLQSHLFSSLPLGTPLHWAVQLRCLLTIRALLGLGADPFYSISTTGYQGNGSAAHLAAAMHDDDIFELFVEHIGPEKRHRVFGRVEDFYPGFLDTAISGRATHTHANGRFERMSRHGKNYKSRTQRMFQLLLSYGLRTLQSKYNSNPTPLNFAVQNGQIDIVEVLLNTQFKDDLEVSSGLDSNEPAVTPLAMSVMRAYDDIYFLLRSHGADSNATYQGIDSILSICAIAGHTRLEVAIDLIKGGNPVNSGRSYAMSPIFWAVWGAHFPLADLLLQHGADINELQDYRTKKFVASRLIEPTTVLGLLLSTCSNSSALPLRWLLYGHCEGKYNLQPITCPSTSSNIFHAIASVEEDGRDEEKLRIALTQVMSNFGHFHDLLDEYAYHAPESSSQHGTTPLIDAIQHSNVMVVKELLALGANEEKTCTDGLRPLQYAQAMLFKFKGLETSRYPPMTLTVMERNRNEIVKLLTSAKSM